MENSKRVDRILNVIGQVPLTDFLTFSDTPLQEEFTKSAAKRSKVQEAETGSDIRKGEESARSDSVKIHRMGAPSTTRPRKPCAPYLASQYLTEQFTF